MKAPRLITPVEAVSSGAYCQVYKFWKQSINHQCAGGLIFNCLFSFVAPQTQTCQNKETKKNNGPIAICI